MEIRTVGVCGAGAMGTGIAHVAAQAGFQVILRDVETAQVERPVATIDGLMQKAIAKGKLTEADRTATLGRIRTTTSLDELAEADFVIEAIFENLALKKELFAALDRLCRPGVVLATNTSSMSITEIAAATGRPECVVGMHFFNPAQVMRLVEVIEGYQSAPETVQTAMQMAERFGKTAIHVRKDTPGFVVNRILLPMMAEAIKVVEEGIATPQEVDQAITLGLNHPMGPFTLLDFTGVDICYNAMEYFYSEFRQPQYAPPQLMKQMVRAGRYGRKAGKGFLGEYPRDTK
ncbi:MAG TPA: 3-hydroxyacyl-CoA dehydrogenase NAD-binding domain-containing protein [Symbiobacteriaceae bacterium]|nr:3-hydroxyacyl-CoA dehydrogenase NAD-binding domain-containing protein [Symbiobacteriaceae bacterium]